VFIKIFFIVRIHTIFKK